MRRLAFEDDKLVRFQHCDPAGIIFYPQYFVLFHELMEDWFTKGLGVNYADMIYRDRIGVPMGRVECEFLAPSRIGETLRFSLRLARIGGSSLTMKVDCRMVDEVRARATLTVIMAHLDGPSALPIPDELRARMADYLE